MNPDRALFRPRPGVFVAFLGAAYCVLSALGLTKAICQTEGCALFSGTSLFGIDLYWIGAGYFLLAGLLLILRWPAARAGAFALIAAGLLADGLLLAVQAVSVPCMSCLIVATLLGATAFLALPRPWGWPRLLGPWLLVFFAALAGLGRSFLGPVPAHGPADAALAVFFSPTCPACKVVVEGLLEHRATATGATGGLALYPVAKDAEDMRRLARLVRELDRLRQSVRPGDPEPRVGVDAAVRACLNDPAPPAAFGETEKTGGIGLVERVRLELLSFRNKAFLAQSRATSVPYLAALRPVPVVRAMTQPRVGQGEDWLAPSTPGPDFDIGGCGFQEAAPCEENAAQPRGF